MAARSNAATESAERELVITRSFDAPRSLVFKAWTDPEHMAHWFGPRGFKSTVLKMDSRPGGAYRIYMRGPEGDDHWTQGIYREFVEPERLVSTFVWTDAEGNPNSPETVLTLTFEDHDQKTRLTLHQAVFESVASCDSHRSGWSSSMERLTEYLATAQ